MKATKAQIVIGFGDVVEVDIADLVSAAKSRGFTTSGRVHNNPRTREEMQGAPIFNELVGPCYGGPGIVRYESAEMNDILST